MNFNVNKYQVGGLIAVQPLPFQSYPQATAAESATAAKSATAGATSDKSSKSKSNLEDDLLKEMVGKAITTDVMKYKDEIDQATIKYSNMSDLEKNSFMGKKLRDFLSGRDFSRINQLQQSKANFDKSIKVVDDNKAYDEVAITPRGLVVMNTESGGLETVSVQEYSKNLNSDKPIYQTITNSELINMREINPALADNTQVFTALSSAKGMPAIQKEVESYLVDLGKTVTNKSENQFLKGKNQNILNAVKEIQDIASDGVFDVETVIKKTTNESQLKIALESVWNNISDSSKQVLKARAARSGASPADIDKTAKGFIGLMIAGRTDTVDDISSNVSYSKELTDKDKEKTSAGQTGEAGFFEALAGNMFPIQKYTFNMGSNFEYKADGSVAGTYRVNNQATGPMMLSDMNDLMSIVNKNNISVGGVPVSYNDSGAILYDGSNLVNMRLPVKLEKDKTGVQKEVPDFQLSKRIEEANKEISSLTIKDINTKRQIYAQHNVDTNAKGEPLYNFKQFIVFDAIVGEEVLPDEIDNALFADEDNEMVTSTFNQKYKYGTGTSTKANEKEAPSRDKFGWFTGDKGLKKTTVALEVSNAGIVAGRYADKNSMLIPKGETTFDYYRQNPMQLSGTEIINKPKVNIGQSEDILNNE